jgi:hypothetical protein
MKQILFLELPNFNEDEPDSDYWFHFDEEMITTIKKWYQNQHDIAKAKHQSIGGFAISIYMDSYIDYLINKRKVSELTKENLEQTLKEISWYKE